MRSRPLIATTFGLILVLGPRALAASASSLLEKGIYTEQTVGDLDEAMAIYRKIIDDAEANRPYVAQAHYRLGMCYLKRGKTAEGVAVLRKLVHRFPEQANLVRLARQHIPGKPFPEFVGCRIKETLSLTVRPPGGRVGSDSPTSVYEYSHLVIEWGLDAKLAGKAKGFFVSVVRTGASGKVEGAPVWSVKDLPAEARSVVCGQASGKMDSPRTELRAGSYAVTVAAHNEAKPIGTATTRLVVKALPYTQIVRKDIQPDGTIKFRSIIQQVNRSGKDLSTSGFINSDFVKVERMIDDRGKPIKFTVKHKGDHYQYRVALNEKISSGDGFLRGSEGTMIGLVKRLPDAEGEFRFRMQHWPGSDIPTRRVEVYRLPKGAEVLDTTPADMARRMQDGRIELFVDKMIPPKGSITTAIRYRLSGARLAKAEALKLNPAPWVDGERMQLTLTSQAGGEIGVLVYTAQGVKVAGKDAWRVESRMAIPMAAMHQFTSVDAERDSFAPIAGRTKTQENDFLATYKSGSVHLDVKRAGKTTSRDIQLNGVAYDNEQVLYLIRRLPLADDYRVAFPIFPVQGGTVVECRIEVTGREKVTVPVGTFDCYKTNLGVYVAGAKALGHTLWLSADKHQYLVKYDSGNALMTLSDIGTIQSGKPATFSDDKLGLSLTAPAGWDFYKPSSPTRGKDMVHLLSPEMKVWSVLATAAKDASTTSVRRVAEGDVESLKGFFKGYTVRPSSWSERQVSGLPAATYVADYTDKDRAMVEQRTYLLGGSAVYWVVFRVEKDQFEATKAELDGIVASFKGR